MPTAQVFPAAIRLPLVGLGTWTQRKPGEVREAVETALRCVCARESRTFVVSRHRLADSLLTRHPAQAGLPPH